MSLNKAYLESISEIIHEHGGFADCLYPRCVLPFMYIICIIMLDLTAMKLHNQSALMMDNLATTVVIITIISSD